ncbi:MAG: class IV adenylate cyclase [Terriglobales bacterium]
MAGPREVEIKFPLADLKATERLLRRAGFRRVTPRTHEMNTLYDLPSGELRARGEVLRLRDYGGKWKLTHKTRGKAGRHKTRVENEIAVSDGRQAENILTALGYRPSFRYEKYRCEWSDGTGHVVLDETPIGNLGEIEGPPRWIDRTARALGIDRRSYITDSYVALFYAWKQRTGSRAKNMTFAETRSRKSARKPNTRKPRAESR